MNNQNNQNRNTAPERRRVRTPGRLANRICLCVIAVIFFALAALNLFQFDRPTVSEAENRNLASFPEFSLEALADGSFFSGISDWVSDTFWQRELMVGLSSKISGLKGFTYKVNGEEYVVIDGPHDNDSEEETTVDRSRYKDITLPPVTTEEPDTSEEPAITDEPVTDSPSTGDSPVTTDTPGTSDVTSGTDVTSEPEVTTEEPFSYVSLKLSDSSAELNEEGMLVLTATLTTRGNGTPDSLVWNVSDTSVLTITANGNTATVLAVKEGSATVSVRVGVLQASCTVKVNKKSGTDQEQIQEITGSIFAYGGAIYQRVAYSGDSLKNISEDYSKLCQYYAALFPTATVSFMPCPHAVLMLDTSKVTKAGRDQGLILSDMASCFDSSINFVNVYSTMKAHDDEYLYFKTDHHWTALGAYYAYTEFARSRGFTPTELSKMESKLVRSDFQGSYSDYLKTYNIGNDKLEVYYPTKAHKITITYSAKDAKALGTTTATYDNCVMPWAFKSYLVFISGDRPVVTINVPENSKENGGSGKSILVIKDSYGNAFVPYLCEHYENIVVVDPRHYATAFSKTIQEQYASYKFDDVLFACNIMIANSYGWLNQFYSIVGVK